LNLLIDILCAFSLLTILPVPFRWLDAKRAPSRAMAAYPLVGVALGMVLTLASVLLQAALSPLLAAALILATWAFLTGGLHLDGWADCCDALPATVTRERRLEILHDPRLGSFGGLGLMLLLLVKFGRRGLAAWPALTAPTLTLAIVNSAAMLPRRDQRDGAHCGIGRASGLGC
jgi:adenosylcobinamide-GDP ribazoletransferase